MMRIIQDPVTLAMYLNCKHCSAEIQFWHAMPPVLCDKCRVFLEHNPVSMIEDVEARIEHFKGDT